MIPNGFFNFNPSYPPVAGYPLSGGWGGIWVGLRQGLTQVGDRRPVSPSYPGLDIQYHASGNATLMTQKRGGGIWSPRLRLI